jgi:uncharacterized protein (TIGR00251 family)
LAAVLSRSEYEPIARCLREHPEGCTLAIRVQPGAKKSAIAGIYGEGSESRLKIALQAPAIEGRANEALVEFLARTFGVLKSSVRIVSGESSRSKVCLLHRTQYAQVEEWLVALLS